MVGKQSFHSLSGSNPPGTSPDHSASCIQWIYTYRDDKDSIICLTAMAFTSIMYFFNITFGKVGSFLMLVFMVIQLAGSAGTYPVKFLRNL